MKHPDDRIEALLGTLAHPKLATIDLSLERMASLLTALGNPQDKLPPVVHIAGTNGKGSLAAYLTAIMQAAGYRVHRYTSPHLVRFNERILLSDKEINDEQLLPLLARVAEHSAIYPVTFFEAITAAAFLAFAETPADIVLLETGLGGRLDATNMVRSPLLTAITPVSIDHTEYLGFSIAEIAGEKAGIIKPYAPCVTGPQVEETSRVIEQAAELHHAPLYRYGNEWHACRNGAGFLYSSSTGERAFPLPNLVGEHQIFNAGTAIACVERLKGFAVTQAHIEQSLTHAVWPGRLQHLTSGHLVSLLEERSELWLDGGHNPGAGEILAQWIKAQGKPVHLICGMLRNKDTEKFLLPLAPHIKSLTAIPIDEEKMSQQPEVIVNLALALSVSSSISNNIINAIETIVKQEYYSYIILICGSLYLAGNILWQNNNIE